MLECILIQHGVQMCALFSFVTVCQVIHDAFSETMIMKGFEKLKRSLTPDHNTIQHNS